MAEANPVIEGDFEAPGDPEDFAKLFSRGDVGQVLITKEAIGGGIYALVVRFWHLGQICIMQQKAEDLPSGTLKEKEQLIDSLFESLTRQSACNIVKNYIDGH